MKHLFIVNPAAGKTDQSAEYAARIKAACDPWKLDYKIRISSHKGNCTELAREAARSGENYRIYVCGGDGTLNEVVCGVAGYPNASVTHFPGGSGNDFIRIFSDLTRFICGLPYLRSLGAVNQIRYTDACRDCKKQGKSKYRKFGRQFKKLGF